MPLPLGQIKQTKTGARGPKPTCICGKCDKCKNRERQKRFAERNREKLLQGVMGDGLLKLEEEDE